MELNLGGEGATRTLSVGHPQHVDVGEQQHRQRRPEVVKDRAGEEERGRRKPSHPLPGSLKAPRRPVRITGLMRLFWQCWTRSTWAC